MTELLAGKVALITGSTSGIGQGIATALAQKGCHIILNGLCEDSKIEEKRAKLAADCNVKVLYSRTDMTDPKQVTSMIEKITQEFGTIDILVNNAGMQHVCPIDEFPIEKWNKIIALNLSAAFHTTRLCVPLMRKQGWGRIINIASAHALVASPYKSAYVAAKHGLYGMTKVVALETAQDNITINAICPGYVWTPLVENQVADTARARGISEEAVKRDVLLAAQPTKKFVTTEQLGQYVVFLCSDHAASITGAALPVDGGWTAQ